MQTALPQLKCTFGSVYLHLTILEFLCYFLFLDDRMKEFEVDHHKILLVRNKDKFSAVGALCTHYGASLSKGKSFTWYNQKDIKLLLL